MEVHARPARVRHPHHLQPLTDQQPNKQNMNANEIAESTATLSEENEKLFIEHAQSLLTSITKVLSDRRAAEASNADDQKLLAGMAEEIERLDAQADGSNLDALINITARKEQLNKLTAKYGKDAQERMAASDSSIAALNLSAEVTALIELGRSTALEKLTLTLRPFFSNDFLVGQCALRTETLNQISRFLNYTPGHVGTVAEIENAVRDLIQPVADGHAPWFFTREPITNEN